MDDQPKSEFMTPREAAEYLDCSLDTVRRLGHAGKLPFERHEVEGSHRRYLRAGVEEYRSRIRHPTARAAS